MAMDCFYAEKTAFWIVFEIGMILHDLSINIQTMTLLKKILMPLALVLLLFFPGLSSKAQHMEAAGSLSLAGARWIGEPDKKFTTGSEMFGDHPASLFRKAFVAGAKVRKATLSITAAGYYLASVNGQPIENNLLEPAWTDYSKRIYYADYDVTTMLRPGQNVLGTMLGNGFYNLLPLRMWGSRNLRDHLPSGQPQFIAKLTIEYADGTTGQVVTGPDWKTAPGPVHKNSVYLGEVYDARKEIPGWDLPGYRDSEWKPAPQRNGPGGVLQPAFFPNVKVSGIIKPVSISKAGNVTIADMGVNLTGVYRISMRGKSGDTIVFRFGERLYGNGTLNPMTTVAGQIKRKGSGGPGAPDIAWQTDSYVFGKNEKITYQPHFTFHTFRYIEISGLHYLPGKDEIVAVELHTGVEKPNSFACSSDLLNSIQKACIQTFLSNLVSVQSDCPAREKFGYGGDLNATSEAYICNFDMQSFYRKTIYDWVDAMQDSIFIDTAPFVGIKYCGISWESAFLTTQYKLFQYYGDTAIVHELYLKDLEWMKKVNKLHPDGIVDKGLSDHESLEKVPVELIGTTHYLDCARIMRKFAEFRHDDANVENFRLLEESLTAKLLDRFWHKPVPGPINRQTLFASLIYYRVIPPKEMHMAADSLLKAVAEGPSGHFTTGIFGTKYILEALSQAGHTDDVFKIVNSTAYPGWGFMIDRGATTIWETWKESDNTFSNCHPMFGSVSEWYYRWLAGIQPLEGGNGFKRFLLAPSFVEGLDAVRAVYNAPAGDIKVSWKRLPDRNIEMIISVPAGTSARFSPSGILKKSWIVTNVNSKASFICYPTRMVVDLPEGDYVIN
jgi:alpha-L-rhamnosidase